MIFAPPTRRPPGTRWPLRWYGHRPGGSVSTALPGFVRSLPHGPRSRCSRRMFLQREHEWCSTWRISSWLSGALVALAVDLARGCAHRCPVLGTGMPCPPRVHYAHRAARLTKTLPTTRRLARVINFALLAPGSARRPPSVLGVVYSLHHACLQPIEERLEQLLETLVVERVGGRNAPRLVVRRASGVPPP